MGQTAQSAGMQAGRRAARAAAQTSASAEQQAAAGIDTAPRLDTQPSGEALLGGAGEMRVERHVDGQSIAALASADSQTSASHSGFSSNSEGQAGVSVQTDQPETPPAN